LAVLLNWLLPGAVVLGIVIFVHELGHFLVAKWRKVRVIRFSLGFGPAIVKFTRGETEYRIAWIPLGGYVQMAGDSLNEDGSMPNQPGEFLSHPWYGRIAILLGGPGANLVTAFLVMSVIGMVGVRYADYPAVMGPVADTSVAARAGLREGDVITSVAGKSVESWIPIFETETHTVSRKSVDLAVKRGDSTFTVSVAPEQRRPFFASLRRIPDEPVVGGVLTGMPAYKAGILEGDRILAVNGEKVTVWDDLPRTLEGQVDKPVRLTILRGTRTFDIIVKPINPGGSPEDQRAQIGIEAPRQRVYVERYSPALSITYGFRGTLEMIANVYGGMWLTVSRPLYYREYLGGPLFIAQAAREQAKRGADSFLQFLAMINVAIMAFNLLPIPVLDGGHIMLALFQALRGQALSARAYLRFQKAGLVVVGTLFILILANDPLRLVQRQRALDKAPREGQVAPAPPP